MGDLSWRFDNREYNYIKEVLESGFASGTSGNMNTRLECAFAKKFGRKYAITFNSGTTTLHASLWALGIGYGDEVITTPLTVISCMNAILMCNAIPVFADVDPNTFLIDPKDIERKITDRTKAVMPVHLYGQVCNMKEIMETAKKYNLAVVEDCAQCYLGYHLGKIGGTFGDVGSWSFENSKHLTTGDGGIIVCDDEELGDRIRKLSCQGFRNATAQSGKIRVSKDLFQNPLYRRHSMYGFMYRLPEVAAAMGLGQLEKLDWFVSLRKKMASKFLDVIKELKCKWLVPQEVPEGDVNSYYTFAAKYTRSDVSWTDFRRKYVKYGGDGIYAAWALCYREDSVPDVLSMLEKMHLGGRLATHQGLCPIAEKIQPQLMQFTTNQKDESEMDKQAECLYKTISYFS
jgi:perosamine synthetase